MDEVKGATTTAAVVTEDSPATPAMSATPATPATSVASGPAPCTPSSVAGTDVAEASLPSQEEQWRSLSFQRLQVVEQVPGPVVAAFMSALQSFVNSALKLGSTQAGDLVPSDNSFHLIGTRRNDNSLYLRGPLPDEFTLVFGGTISRVPQKGALLVATAFKHNFYVICSNLPVANDEACPAWSVATAPTTKKGAQKIASNLIVVKHVLQMPFKWWQFLQQMDITVDVTLHVLRKDIESMEIRPHQIVKLLRPDIADQVKTAPVKAPKALALKEDKSQFKHLLR